VAGFDITTIMISIVTVIIWLIRLESKVLSIDRDLAKAVEHNEKNGGAFQQKIDKLHNDLTEIKLALVRIESRMFRDKGDKHGSV
jgi:hypothetical protein